MSARPITRLITSRKAAIAYNDVDALAQKVDGFDNRNYFDQQGEVETVEATQRWPLLARAMGLELAAAEIGEPAQNTNAATPRE